jgi:TonB family protein
MRKLNKMFKKHEHYAILVSNFCMPILACFFINGVAIAQNFPSASPLVEYNQNAEKEGWGRSCVRPVWPKQSLLREEEGVVDVNFVVDIDGAVIKTKIRKSSGFPLLDQAAQQAIERCRFQPEYVDGKPAQTSQNLRYVWTLENQNSWQYKFPPSSWLNKQ